MAVGHKTSGKDFLGKGGNSAFHLGNLVIAHSSHVQSHLGVKAAPSDSHAGPPQYFTEVVGEDTPVRPSDDILGRCLIVAASCP
jgi:hypothetical protein